MSFVVDMKKEKKKRVGTNLIYTLEKSKYQVDNFSFFILFFCSLEKKKKVWRGYTTVQ